jgi:hypothetical protein
LNCIGGQRTIAAHTRRLSLGSAQYRHDAESSYRNDDTAATHIRLMSGHQRSHGNARNHYSENGQKYSSDSGCKGWPNAEPGSELEDYNNCG